MLACAMVNILLSDAGCEREQRVPLTTMPKEYGRLPAARSAVLGMADDPTKPNP